MKRLLFAVILVFAAAGTEARLPERFSFAASVGTGISLNTPSRTPFTWQVLCYYPAGRRFSAGIGTGLSFYERVLIPLFADVKFTITGPRRFTPYLECAVGYGFAPGNRATGGMYLGPSAGVQYPVGGRGKLFLALGYEQQAFERLNRYAHPLFAAEFAEKLNHRSLMVKVGFLF